MEHSRTEGEDTSTREEGGGWHGVAGQSNKRRTGGGRRERPSEEEAGRGHRQPRQRKGRRRGRAARRGEAKGQSRAGQGMRRNKPHRQPRCVVDPLAPQLGQCSILFGSHVQEKKADRPRKACGGGVRGRAAEDDRDKKGEGGACDLRQLSLRYH